MVVVTVSVRAQADASAPDKAAARELGIAGIQLADKGDCPGAIAKLQKAAELYAAPTIVERLGECQIAVGKLVAGTESLQSVLHQDLGPAPNPVFVEAQKRAQKVLDAARPRIAKVVIHVTGPRPEDASVMVDGDRVPSALLDAERPTDPGAHQVVASAPGFKETSASVMLAEGARSEVTLALEPSAAPAAPGAPIVPVAPTTFPTPTHETTPTTQPSSGGAGGRSLALPIASFLVGAAGLAVGATFGILAINKKSSLDSVCIDKTCPTQSQSDIDSLNTTATISTVGWVVGGIGVGGSLLLLLATGGGPKEPAAPAHAALRPVIGPSSLGFGGSF
jgi:hypothetical protein